MDQVLDHIAFLTGSLETFFEALPPGAVSHGVEEQPCEGTREMYVSLPGLETPRLLLMEPMAPGPYSSALQRRGSGLHHIAMNVSDFGEYFEKMNSLRLLLHPISLETQSYGTLWLCRPGVPFLLELNQCQGREISPVKSELTLIIPGGARRGEGAEINDSGQWSPCSGLSICLQDGESQRFTLLSGESEFTFMCP